MKRILVLMALGLSACAPSHWVRNPDPAFGRVGNPDSFEVDKQECIWRVQASAPGAALSWPLMTTQCLRSKGWVPGGES